MKKYLANKEMIDVEKETLEKLLQIDACKNSHVACFPESHLREWANSIRERTIQDADKWLANLEFRICHNQDEVLWNNAVFKCRQETLSLIPSSGGGK